MRGVWLKIQDLKKGDLQIFFLIAALILYGVLGSPTPDHPGLAELMIGVLLMAAANPVYVFFQCKERRFWSGWRGAGGALFLYALLPLGTGLMAGHAPGLILRDVIPFLFMVMPLFFDPALEKKPQRIALVCIFIVFVGLAFSLRSFGSVFDPAYWLGGVAELTYFANAPTVLFAALFCIGLAGEKILRARALSDILKIAILLSVTAIALIAMILMVQRAFLGAFVLYSASLTGLAVFKMPYRAWRLLILIIPALVFGFPYWSGIGQMLFEKTQNVGFNMRAQEWGAVWNVLKDEPVAMLLGTGWGGTFSSPAVGGLSVSFTHGLLSSMLLKTGIVGCALSVFYIGALLKTLAKPLIQDPILALALIAPVLIDVFLYASFKSLDFGLILLLVSQAGRMRQNVA